MSDHPHDFASDNHAGAHPEVLEAIARANVGHTPSYGADPWTADVEELFRHHFGGEARTFLVFNGTGANVSSLSALAGPHDAIICPETAHLHVDECGAPERMTGAKLLTVATEHGKLTPDDVARFEQRRDDEHFRQPRAVSITQSTELGTVYTADETRAIADAAHGLGMYLHVDGARLANAAAAAGASLRELTTDAGVDALSFGGTKNGLLFGEAVVFLRPDLADRFELTRKQLAQLASKMRFVAAQFQALLHDDLWQRGAAHANAMARRLADAVESVPALELAHPVQANAVFARLPLVAARRLLESAPGEHPFYFWDEDAGLVRWMCSWDTTQADVDAFAEAVRAAIEAG